LKVTKHYPNMSVEVEGETLKDVFVKFAEIEEVLLQVVPGNELKKGVDSNNWRFGVRNVTAPDKDNPKKMKNYTYYELVSVEAPYPRLSIGLRDDGVMYPKRKRKDGSFIGTGGWETWKGNPTPGGDDSED